MKVTVYNETDILESGTYTAQLTNAFEYVPEQLCMKFKLCENPDNTVFLKFASQDELGRHPWGNVFQALNTNNTDDLVGHTFQLEISTVKSKKTGNRFSNVKKVKVVQ